jgi:hypothetical protein
MLMALSGLGEGHRATIREKQVNDASPIAVSERRGDVRQGLDAWIRSMSDPLRIRTIGTKTIRRMK